MQKPAPEINMPRLFRVLWVGWLVYGNLADRLCRICAVERFFSACSAMFGPSRTGGSVAAPCSLLPAKENSGNVD